MDLTQKTKLIQKYLNIKEDGKLGPHTRDCMYRQFAIPEYPYREYFYGQNVFLADPNKVEPFDPRVKPLKNFRNTVSGSFSWTVDGRWQPISVLISNYKVICPTACHATDINMPESVLWYDGKTHGIDRIKHVNELKNLKEIKWAIGGLGLKKLNDRGYYDNKAEGFTGPFSDVLRVTSHMIIGFDKSSFIAICVKSMGINEIRNLVDDMGLTDAIMLDGGSLTGYNFGNYKFNTSTPQRYAIQLGG